MCVIILLSQWYIFFLATICSFGTTSVLFLYLANSSQTIEYEAIISEFSYLVSRPAIFIELVVGNCFTSRL